MSTLLVSRRGVKAITADLLEPFSTPSDPHPADLDLPAPAESDAFSPDPEDAAWWAERIAEQEAREAELEAIRAAELDAELFADRADRDYPALAWAVYGE